MAGQIKKAIKKNNRKKTHDFPGIMTFSKHSTHPGPLSDVPYYKSILILFADINNTLKVIFEIFI
jgi:hypothetical protein